MIDTVIEVAKEAGKIQLQYYGKIKAEYKDILKQFENQTFNATTVFTQADIESEKKINSILEKNFPAHNIFGEELIRKNKNSEYTRYIDPIDGTSNYVRNIPLFGISIGLVKNKQPILGVLYFPMLDLLVTAQTNKGTFANGNKI